MTRLLTGRKMVKKLLLFCALHMKIGTRTFVFVFILGKSTFTKSAVFMICFRQLRLDISSGSSDGRQFTENIE